MFVMVVWLVGEGVLLRLHTREGCMKDNEPRGREVIVMQQRLSSSCGVPGNEAATNRGIEPELGQVAHGVH
jgi:hypothetical protein